MMSSWETDENAVLPNIFMLKIGFIRNHYLQGIEISLDQLKHSGDIAERIQGTSHKEQQRGSRTWPLRDSNFRAMISKFVSLYDVSLLFLSEDSVSQYSQLQMRDILAGPGGHCGLASFPPVQAVIRFGSPWLESSE